MFLLQWSSHDEGSHVILGKSEANVQDVAMHVFKKHNDAKLQSYLEIEIVAPSNKLQELYAYHSRQDGVNNFHQEVVSNMRQIVEAKKKLPPQFAKCTKYDPAEEITDAYSATYYYECRNCKDTIRLVNITPEELYDTYFEAWQKLDLYGWGNRKTKDKRVLSQATQANDDEPLWYAYANFGHHADGIVLAEIKLEDAYTFRPHYLSDNVLFFFRHIRALDKTPIQEQLDKRNAEIKKLLKDDMKRREANRKSEEKKRIESIIAVFKEKQ